MTYKTIQIDGKQKRLHRYLIEKKLGRELSYNEIVHHKDGNIRNNKINNLKLISRADHMRMHKNIKEASLKVQQKYFINRGEIHKMYILEKMKKKDVAEKMKIPLSTINWYLFKHGITRWSWKKKEAR